MTEQIIIAGSGGQGVMLLGKILATAAMKENKFVTWLPSYGAEVRGGAAYCMVIISDNEIGSPRVDKADTFISLNKLSLEKLSNRLKNKGMIIFNSSLVQNFNHKNTRVFGYPFTEIAIRLGNIKVANMVALGSFVAQKGIVQAKTIFSVIKEFAPAGKKELIEINERALEEGVNLK